MLQLQRHEVLHSMSNTIERQIPIQKESVLLLANDEQDEENPKHIHLQYCSNDQEEFHYKNVLYIFQ